MDKSQHDDLNTLATIPDRLTQLRNKNNLSLADVARLFNVNKSTVLRWESKEYWQHQETPNKRLLLLQLVELYHADYGWVLHGATGINKDSSNILILDDDATSLSIMTLIIKSFVPTQFKLVNFSVPDKALSWAEENASALVFCDYRMPTMKGDIFIMNLRKISTYSIVPVIAVTQVREPGMPKKLFEAGATHVLQKSIDQEKLQSILQLYSFN